METWLASQIPKVFEKNNIDVEPKEATLIYKRMGFYLYNLIYNICALVATLVKVHDPKNKSLKPKHLKDALEYVQKKCYPDVATKTKQSGGSYTIDSEYFGKPSGSYTNDMGTDLLPIVFDKGGYLRPEISGGAKAKTFIEISYIILSTSERKDLFPNNDIIDILDRFNVNISRNSLKLLKKIIKMHLNCLMIDLYNDKPITLSKLDKIIKLSRHAVFH